MTTYETACTTAYAAAVRCHDAGDDYLAIYLEAREAALAAGVDREEAMAIASRVAFIVVNV